MLYPFVKIISNIIRFNQSEMKRLYRIFKSECPSGLITEEVFHNIFSKFFPLGAESYNGEINELHPVLFIIFCCCENQQCNKLALHCIFEFCVWWNSPDFGRLACFSLMSGVQYISDLLSAYSIFQFIWSLLISSKRELLLPLCFLSTSAGWLWCHYVWGKLLFAEFKISNFPQCIEGCSSKSSYLIHFPGFCCGSLNPRERDSGGETGVDISPLRPWWGRSHHQRGDGGRRHVGQ